MVQNESLSLRARGLYALLCASPNSNFKDLKKISKLSDLQLRKVLKELLIANLILIQTE